jgi:hypothetical protein
MARRSVWQRIAACALVLLIALSAAAGAYCSPAAGAAAQASGRGKEPMSLPKDMGGAGPQRRLLTAGYLEAQGTVWWVHAALSVVTQTWVPAAAGMTCVGVFLGPAKLCAPPSHDSTAALPPRCRRSFLADMLQSVVNFITSQVSGDGGGFGRPRSGCSLHAEREDTHINTRTVTPFPAASNFAPPPDKRRCGRRRPAGSRKRRRRQRCTCSRGCRSGAAPHRHRRCPPCANEPGSAAASAVYQRH